MTLQLIKGIQLREKKSEHRFVWFMRNRGSHLSAHVLLNSLIELRKRDKMRGLPSIFSLFLQRV